MLHINTVMPKHELASLVMEAVQQIVVVDHNQELYIIVISTSQIKLVQMAQKVEVVILTTVHQAEEVIAVLLHQKQTDMVIDGEAGSAAEDYARENGLLFDEKVTTADAFDIIRQDDQKRKAPVWFMASGGAVFAFLTGIFMYMATRHKRG